MPSLRILGSPQELSRSGHMVSFVSKRAHAHDIAAFMNMKGICVRAGNHCAQILHARLGVDASVRASFYLYTTRAEVEALIAALEQATTFLG